MGKGRTYTKNEIEYITKMLDTKQRTAREIAETLGRKESDIKKKYQKIRAASRKKLKESVEKEEINNNLNTATVTTTTAPIKTSPVVSTVTMSPREMIKRLYDLGYRIEDNKIVCYVKQVVNVHDIINNR